MTSPRPASQGVADSGSRTGPEGVRTRPRCSVRVSWRGAPLGHIACCSVGTTDLPPGCPRHRLSHFIPSRGSCAPSKTWGPPPAPAHPCGRSLSALSFPASSHLSVPGTSLNSLSPASRCAFPTAQCSPHPTESHCTPRTSRPLLHSVNANDDPVCSVTHFEAAALSVPHHSVRF